MSIKFDGSDDFVTAGTNDIIKENAAITISAWLYPLSTGGGSLARIVFRRDTQGTTTGFNFLLNSVDVTNGIQFLVDSPITGAAGRIIRTSASNSITLNSWQHVLLTWDGSLTATNAHIYVNGVEVSYSTTQNGVDVGDTVNQTIYIGNRESLNRCFDGNLTELAIWDIVLSSGDIASLSIPVRRTPLGISAGNLKAYWSINDSQSGSANGALISDLSGGGNTATGNNGVNGTGLIWQEDVVFDKFKKTSSGIGTGIGRLQMYGV